jgi:hypothetical protein
METVCKHLSDIIQTWFRHHWDNIQTSFRYHSNIIQTSFRHYLDNTKTTTVSNIIKITAGNHPNMVQTWVGHHSGISWTSSKHHSVITLSCQTKHNQRSSARYGVTAKPLRMPCEAVAKPQHTTYHHVPKGQSLMNQRGIIIILHLWLRSKKARTNDSKKIWQIKLCAQRFMI